MYTCSSSSGLHRTSTPSSVATLIFVRKVPASKVKTENKNVLEFKTGFASNKEVTHLLYKVSIEQRVFLTTA